MKNIILILALCITSFSLYAQELTPKRTVVAGRIINATSKDSKELSVIFCDPLNNHSRIFIDTNNKGKFHAQYDMYLSQAIIISYNNNIINLFINPSDSVYIEIDMDKFREHNYEGLTFSGSGAELNNQFAKFVNHLNKISPVKLDDSLPPKEFIASIKERAKILEDSMDIYAKGNEPSPFIKDWAKRNIIYSIANYEGGYAQDNTSYKLEVFTDPFFDIYNVNNFQIVYFPLVLENVMSSLVAEDERFLQALDDANFKDAALFGVETLSKQPASFSRDYMIFALIKSLSEENPDLYKEFSKDIFINKICYDKLRLISEHEN
ncbi:MAG: hypothetical protein RSB85_01205 [Rikenellaceae bacterium]